MPTKRRGTWCFYEHRRHNFITSDIPHSIPQYKLLSSLDQKSSPALLSRICKSSGTNVVGICRWSIRRRTVNIFHTLLWRQYMYYRNNLSQMFCRKHSHTHMALFKTTVYHKSLEWNNGILQTYELANSNKSITHPKSIANIRYVMNVCHFNSGFPQSQETSITK